MKTQDLLYSLVSAALVKAAEELPRPGYDILAQFDPAKGVTPSPAGSPRLRTDFTTPAWKRMFQHSDTVPNFLPQPGLTEEWNFASPVQLRPEDETPRIEGIDPPIQPFPRKPQKPQGDED